MQSSFHHRPGLTLLEVLLYVGIMVMLTVAASQLLFMIIGSSTKGGTVRHAQQNMIFALERIRSQAKTAQAVNVSQSIWDTDTGRLSLSMVASSENPTVYSLSSGQVWEKKGSTAAKPLTSSGITISVLRFTRLTPAGGAETVRMDIRATGTGTSATTFSLDFSAAVTLHQ